MYSLVLTQDVGITASGLTVQVNTFLPVRPGRSLRSSVYLPASVIGASA